MNEPLRRAYAHWYQDGLGEMVQSLVFLLLGSYYFLLFRLPADSPARASLPLILPLLIIGLVLASRPLLRALKARISRPRVGFVAYKKEKISRSVLIRLGIGISFALIIQIVGIFLSARSFNWTIFSMGFGFGLIYLYSGWRVSAWRLIACGVIALIFSFALAFTGWRDSFALAVFFFSFAALTFIIGLVTLLRFLRRNPVVDLTIEGSEPNELLEEEDHD